MAKNKIHWSEKESRDAVINKISEKTKEGMIKEVKENLSKALLGKKHTILHNNKISEGNKKWHKEIGFSPETKRKIGEGSKGLKRSEAVRKILSLSKKRYLKSHPEMIDKMRITTTNAYLRGCYHLSPNKPEKLLHEILIQNFPSQFIYTGDGKISVGGFIPDFIHNEERLIIELFGDYWHSLPNYVERDKRRLKCYSEKGFKTLIIWEHELMDEEKVINKIFEFTKLILIGGENNGTIL